MVKKNSWDFDTSFPLLKGHFGDRIITDRPLSDLNTFGTGGTASLFMEVKSGEELARLVKVVAKLNIPIFMLGGGSNVLIRVKSLPGWSK